MQGDHIIPRSWPGVYDNDKSNVTPACGDCNMAKGSCDPVVWFFLLLRRDKAMPGRRETLADIQAERLLHYWGDAIIETAAAVAGLAVAS